MAKRWDGSGFKIRISVELGGGHGARLHAAGYTKGEVRDRLALELSRWVDHHLNDEVEAMIASKRASKLEEFSEEELAAEIARRKGAEE